MLRRKGKQIVHAQEPVAQAETETPIDDVEAVEAQDEIAEERIEKEHNEAEIAVLETPLGKYIQDENVTDISFNGTDGEIRVQDNTGLHKIIDKEITSEVIMNLGKRISNQTNSRFDGTDSILDAAVGRFRFNFVHSSLSISGATCSIRISKPRLAIQDPSALAAPSVIQLLNLGMKIGENTIISGQTGSGKTELQKFLVGYIPDDRKISLMEDTPDSHLKALYPNKDINSWVTRKPGTDGGVGVTFTDLLKAALRNNPDWAIISETRGEEAKYMVDAAQTDHSIITTLHASGAQMIPDRILSMIAQGSKDFNELLMGSNIVEVLTIGVHMYLDRSHNKMNRFIREVVEFTGYSQNGAEYTYLYRVLNKFDEETNEYTTTIETGPVSERFVDKLKLNRLYHKLPVYHNPDAYDYDENGKPILNVKKAEEIYMRQQEHSNKEKQKFELIDQIGNVTSGEASKQKGSSGGKEQSAKAKEFIRSGKKNKR